MSGKTSAVFEMRIRRYQIFQASEKPDNHQAQEYCTRLDREDLSGGHSGSGT